MEGEPHRWVLSTPGTPSSAMRLMTEIAADTWVLDDKVQYTLEHDPLQCLAEFGTERVLWLSEPIGESAHSDHEESHSA